MVRNRRFPQLRWRLRLTVALVSALAVILSTSSARATTGIPSQQGDPAMSVLGTKAKYLVLIVLDGARPDYLTVPGLPHLQALESHGTVYNNAVSGILESETPSGHTTISTGSTPRHNGILGFSWAENDSRYSLFNPDIVRAGAMERIMQNAHASTIAGLYKARFPSAKVVALSGHKYYAADPLGGPQADAIMYFRNDSTNHYAPTAIPGHVPPYGVLEAPGLSVAATDHQLGEGNALATKLALSSFAVMHQRITLINYPDFDWPLGHVDGGSTDRPAVIQMMQVFDRDLGLLEDAFNRAGVLKNTLFVVTADHGMSPLKRFVPETLFSNAIKQAGAISVDQTFSNGVYLWLKGDTKAMAVAANIVKAHNPGIAAVYYWRGWGKKPRYMRSPGAAVSKGLDSAYRFLLNTMVNGHQPEVVTFLKKNATAVQPTTAWKADHGGASWNSQHIPLILSGPGIRSGVVSGAPAQLIDIAPTVLADMGVRPSNMDGHVLTDAMRVPAAADEPSRAAEVKRLTPILQAMIAEDHLENTQKY